MFVVRYGIGLGEKTVGIGSIVVYMVVVGEIETLVVKGGNVVTVSGTDEIFVGGGSEKVVRDEVCEMEEGMDEVALTIL